jgi:signal transduction histidine kinase
VASTSLVIDRRGRREGQSKGMNTVGGDLGQAEARAAAAEDRLRSQTIMRAEAEHRMKTLLAVIGGWASTLDDRWDQLSEGRRREAVGIIRRAADSLVQQAGRLLEDARAEMHMLDLEPVRLDLAAVLEVTTSAYDGISESHVVRAAPPVGPVAVEVDPAALQQVLGLLVENAVKYSPPGTSVVLSAYRVDDAVFLDVRDEGIGVTDEVDVFAPFQRGPVGDELPGVGLGLYIVRNLVEAMGGEVTARRNDGAGSTFTVRLPVAD